MLYYSREPADVNPRFCYVGAVFLALLRRRVYNERHRYRDGTFRKRARLIYTWETERIWARRIVDAIVAYRLWAHTTLQRPVSSGRRQQSGIVVRTSSRVRYAIYGM